MNGPGAARLALVVALAAALGTLALVAALQLAGMTSSALLLSDVRALAALPVSAGWLSDIGILIWSSAASVCLFAALQSGLREPLGRYLLATAALTGWLALDDALLLHERVLPRLLGVGQGAVYAVYVAAVLGWLVAYREHHRRRLPLWLVSALGCFAASVLLDLVPPDRRLPPHWHPLLEDGFKWVGIVIWSVRAWCLCLLERAAPGAPSRRSSRVP